MVGTIDPQVLRPQLALAEHLRETLAEVVEVVGSLPERIGRRASSHRLMRLCEQMQLMAKAFSEDQKLEKVEVHLTSMAELRFHLDLLKAAKAELSEWEKVLAMLVDPTNYDHFILTLAVQRMFRTNWGLTTQLIPEVAGMRTPDLMIYSEGEALAAVEVKTKDDLKDPIHLLPYARAQGLVESAMASIGNSKTGQLKDGKPSVLVIAGFFVDAVQTQLLRKAAAEWFRRHKGRKRSMAGMMFASIFVYAKDGAPLSPISAVDMQFVHNPAYNLHEELTLYIHQRDSIAYGPAFQRWQPDIRMVRDGDDEN